MSAPQRSSFVLYSSDAVAVLEYPPHMPGYFSLYGLRVRAADGTVHLATLSERELAALRDALNRLDGLAP